MPIQPSSVDSQTIAMPPARQPAAPAGSSRPASRSDGAAQPAVSQSANPSPDAFLSSAQTIQAAVQNTPLQVAYGVDKGSGLQFFKFVDPDTQRTIRQIPAEEVLSMAKRLRQASHSQGTKGVLLDAVG
jgi:flagellar protein FlaG